MPLVPTKPTALCITGVVLVGFALVASFAMQIVGKEYGVLPAALIGGLGGGAAFAGRKLYNMGRRLGAALRKAFPADRKDAVVYLRSFQEDSKTSEGVGSGVAFGGFSTTTEEEQLVLALAEVGPVIAVGQPGEELPPLGAVRLNFTHEEWQHEVEDLLRQAALVVIRPGAFSHIRKAVEIVAPERLLLVIAGRQGKHQDIDLGKFGLQINSLIPTPIPAAYATKRLYGLGTVRAFVRFGERWQPELLPLTVSLVPFLKRSVTKRLVPYYREALRPALASIGHAPPELRFSPFQVGAVGCLGMMFLSLAIMLLIAWLS